MKRCITLLVCLIAICSKVFCQKKYITKPIGVFLQDSIRIGEPILYALSYKHSPSDNVFFPDTTFDFSPFEIVEQQSFSTITRNNKSLDSAVYELRTFNTQSIQELKLPVLVINQADSFAVYSNRDAIILKTMLKQGVAKKLRTSFRLEVLEEETNFPFLFLCILAFLIVIVLVNWLAGSYLNMQWSFFLLWLHHLKFIRQFQQNQRGAFGKNTILSTERAIVLWKKYIERLENKPITTYTTKEIIAYFPKEQILAEALRSTDIVIYGGMRSDSLDMSLNILKKIAINRYQHTQQRLLLAYNIQKNKK